MIVTFFWDSLKFILILGIITFTLVYTAINITPQCFDHNTCYKCASSIHDKGLCAGKNIENGESIGHMCRLYSGVDYKDSEQGKLINHSNKGNIDFLPLYKDKYIDIYGYANKDIDKDCELITDFTQKFFPKPNFIDKGNNNNLFPI